MTPTNPTRLGTPEVRPQPPPLRLRARKSLPHWSIRTTPAALDRLSTLHPIDLRPSASLVATAGLRTPDPQSLTIGDPNRPRRGMKMPAYRQVNGDLFVDGVSPKDVDQGAIGTCWILASLAAIAHRDPERIKELITDNGDGSYTVHFHRLMWAGKWTLPGWQSDVRVTPELPSFAAGTKRAGGKHELWVPLIEKAYAQWKLGNNYWRIDGGFPDTALTAFTGKRSDAHMFCRTPQHLKEVLSEAIRNDHPIVVGTKPWGTPRGGMVTRHAYAVLDLIEEDGKTFVTLYNPWGHHMKVSIEDLHASVMSTAISRS